MKFKFQNPESRKRLESSKIHPEENSFGNIVRRAAVVTNTYPQVSKEDHFTTVFVPQGEKRKVITFDETGEFVSSREDYNPKSYEMWPV